MNANGFKLFLIKNVIYLLFLKDNIQGFIFKTQSFNNIFTKRNNPKRIISNLSLILIKSKNYSYKGKY